MADFTASAGSIPLQVRDNAHCDVRTLRLLAEALYRGLWRIGSPAVPLLGVQILQTPHPPRRRIQGRVPRVHRGFLRTWTVNSIDSEVLQFVGALLAARPPAERKVVCCGHSLGGAVATLAAFDIARGACGVAVPESNVMCYTFGCPRVGNHAFADEYAAAVPNTWHVINKQDAVARAMKVGRWCAAA